MLTVDRARALITTSLTDDELADVIAREEAWLARRIGPLDGERVETFMPVAAEALQLRRPTSGVTVTDDSGSPVVELRGWADVHLSTDGAAWGGTIEVSYTPDDEDEVTRALLTLLRLTVAERAYASESAGVHSYTYDQAMAREMRWEAWRSLLRPGSLSSMRLVSSVPTTTQPTATVSTTVTGS
jgi:hypothetical protein